MITRVNSGFNTGADISGIRAAYKLGIKTTGWMPKGWKTLDGPKPEYEKMYGALEDESLQYPPRTEKNVQMADITLRFAGNFDSPGEKCTLNAIKKYNKPYYDIGLSNPSTVRKVAGVIISHNYRTINVAGNTERTFPGISRFVEDYCTMLFAYLLGYEAGHAEGIARMEEKDVY